MEPTTTERDTIYSTLSTDPDLAELVDLFVEEIPDRLDAIEQAFSAGDQPSLQRAAHQLKGAAGSYGFPQVTPVAASLERAVGEGEAVEAIRDHIDQLADLCQRLRAGRPEGAPGQASGESQPTGNQ